MTYLFISMNKLQHCYIKMTKIFLFFALLVFASRNCKAYSSVFGSITNSSSTQDVLDAIYSLKDGNLDAGANEVLNKLNNVIQNEIDNIDNTIKKLHIDENSECKKCTSIFERMLKSINRNENQQLDENHPAKSVISFLAKSSDRLLQNVTKTVYKIVDILEELSDEFKTNNSVDTDTLLAIILIIYDEIIYETQIYDEEIAATLKNLLNANSITIVDDIVKAERDLSYQLIGVQTVYYKPLEEGKKCIKDVASGKKTKSLDEVIKNLKSIKNGKKNNQKVKNIIRDVKNKLNGQTYTVDDLIEAIKADKPSKFYSNFQMINLQAGYNLILGVNDIRNSEVLQNIVNSLKEKDHKELLSGIAVEFKKTSGIFKNLLAQVLKAEILTINNPSILNVFQIVFDYYSELEKDGLRKARELVEYGHPKNGESKKSSFGKHGESGESKASNSGENAKSDECQGPSSNGDEKSQQSSSGVGFSFNTVYDYGK